MTLSPQFFYVPDREGQKALILETRALIERACQTGAAVLSAIMPSGAVDDFRIALQALLVSDLDRMIHALSQEPQEPQEPQLLWATTDALMRAQAECEAAQQQIDEFEISLDAMPAEFRPVMRAAMMGILTQPLRRAERDRAEIQAALESGKTR